MSQSELPQVSVSRRAFLKSTGAAAVGTAVPVAVSATASTPALQSTSAPAGRPALEYVNLLQGTASTPEVSLGNTLPIAALPFGMAHWTLQSDGRNEWFFHPSTRRVEGFRCTHQLSPWLGDYGQAVFLPFRGEILPEPRARASSYAVEDAQLSPHSLKLLLLRSRARAELIPTERCALLTTEFLQDGLTGECGLLIDIPGDKGEVVADAASRHITFESRANTGAVPDNFANYYVVETDAPWQRFETKTIHGSRVAILHFGQATHITARIATSFLSTEQAKLNLQRELGTQTPDQLRAAAAKVWTDHLNRIEIKGATEEQRRTFYSCLYRTLLFPRIFHEPDVNGKPHHYSAFTGQPTPGVMYADHGYWDVYHAWYPLMSLLFPERLSEILQGWTNAYKEGGWFPQFPSPGYRACMTGSLIDAVFADAAVKDIPGVDYATAYEGLHKHATSAGNPAKGYGRVGFEYYNRLGYVPADRVEQAVAESLDGAYGDFCVAQVATKLGKAEDARFFNDRSENWRKLLDPKTNFFRGKKEDGSWLEPFHSYRWGAPYVEGSAWQHRFDAAQNYAGLFQAMGGNNAAAKALHQLVTAPPVFEIGIYGYEIHEMSEMAAVDFGQYAHSNQPSHHLLYLFALAGRPEETERWVRRTLNQLYTPDTFAGDEDTGSMAAWYILSSLGFYPTCPGKPEYTLGSPLFPSAVVHLPRGKILQVEAENNTPANWRVRGVSFAGKPVGGPNIAHSSLIQGGTLHFTMAAGDPA